MQTGQVASASGLRSIYQTSMQNYTGFVWSLSSYPQYFPTAQLGIAGSIASTISSPTAGSVMTATTSLKDVLRASAKTLTSIVNCRFTVYMQISSYVRVGLFMRWVNSTSTIFDQTQRALLNTGYQVDISDGSPVAGQVASASVINTFFQSIQAQVAAAQSRMYAFSTTVCHSSCHNSCHGSRSRR